MTADFILEELEKRSHRSVHFIGIGGIGMASAARWFMAHGWSVSGSDLSESDLVRELAKEGVRFSLGHKEENIGTAGIIIRSQAILPTNVEYRAAARKKLPIVTYPELVGALSRRYETIAVAGAHGKSTTTALLSLITITAKKDPTVIIGTKLKELQGKNFRNGKGPYLVLEADEYGRAFLNYSPSVVLVTNIDREHLDTYSGLADIKRTFLELFSRVRKGGSLVLNEDNEHLLSLKDRIERIAKDNKLKVFWYSLEDRMAKKIKAVLRIPGRHNLSNAMGAYILARKALNIPEEAALKAIGAFRGSWRRYEFKGVYKLGAVTYDVYDDYAHHPTEIKATLEAFREKFPTSAVICVFQPHQAERLKRLFPDFKKAFGAADALILFPEYRVAGRDEKPNPFTAKALALALQKKNPKSAVAYFEDVKHFSRNTVREAYLRSGLSHRKAVVVMMGAGNVVEQTKKLLP